MCMNYFPQLYTIKEFYIFHSLHTISVFGGLGVACWPLVTKSAGSKPSDF